MTTDEILINYSDALQKAVNKYGFEKLKTILTNEGLVVEEVRKGYMLGDKVLRPAQVKILRIKEEQLKDIFDYES